MAGSNATTESAFNRALLSWIQQSAPYGVITLDLSLNIQGWNSWMELHSGAKFESVAGKKMVELFPDLKTRKLLSRFERALLGESSVLSTALHNYLLPFPSPLPYAGFDFMRQTAHINPLHSGTSVCGVIVIIEDVTQRESQAEDLRWQHYRDEILSSALGYLLKTEEPRNAIRQLFFKVAEHLELDTFLFYVADDPILRLHTAGGVSDSVQKDLHECPFQFDEKSEEPAIIRQAEIAATPGLEPLRRLGITCAVVIPLFAKEGLLGAVCFASARRDTIEMEEVELLKIIAQHLATAIDRQDTSNELKKAQKQLVNYSLQLENRVLDRTSRLQEIVSELETLSYTLAHDLKAPLRGMTAYCKILLTDFAAQLPEDGTTVVNRLLLNSERMEGLIRDLLDFSRVSQNEIHLSTVEVSEVLNEVLALRLPAVRQAITIRGQLHRVRAHKILLQQVLSNLIDNAIKFVEPNVDPTITIYSEVVAQLSPSTRSWQLIFSSVQPLAPDPASKPSTPDKKGIRIWVIDQGIGIAPQAHQKVFGIFERGATEYNYEGNGMGLAIVARAMQRMAGSCGVESQLGKGSRFWIEFPVD